MDPVSSGKYGKEKSEEEAGHSLVDDDPVML
jgi:hypothetical protein